MLARWLTLLPATAAIFAQTALEPASISGTVTNSVTGEPVLRAHVMLRCNSPDPRQGQATYGALTNAKGEFTVSPLPAANCFLDAQRVGFVIAPIRSNYSLKSGTHTENVKLTLIPTGAITGRVLTATGEPAPDIEVSAETSNMSSGGRTDDKGQFRIGGLRPGRYRVKATRREMPFPAEIRADGSVELRDAATYYPSATDSKMAQRVEVKPGAEVSGLEIRMLQTPVVKVSGKVTGVPPGMKDVMVNDTPSGQGAALKADGTFVLWRLDPGVHTLRALHWGPTRVMSSAVQIEVTSANVENLELRIIPPFEIAGQLRFDDDQAREQPKPPTRPDGTAPPAPPPQPRSLNLTPERLELSFGGAQTMVSSDDSFTLEQVQPGRYRIRVSGVSGYVRSVRTGDTETDGDLLDISNGSRGSVTLTLSSNYCEISGTVNDSSGPVADATVILARPDDTMNTRTVRSDSAGAYKFQVAPGKYHLAVVDKEATMWGNLAADLEDFQPEELELNAGDKITKNLVQRK